MELVLELGLYYSAYMITSLFITKITFEKEFKGNITEGREEPLKKQQEQEAAEAARLEKLRQIGRKKPGEM